MSVHKGISRTLVLLGAIALLIPGCASPSWQSGYRPLTADGALAAPAGGESAPRTAIAPATAVELKRVPLEQISIGSVPEDCVAIGFSEYQRTRPGGLEDEARLIDFARGIGATRVLWGSGFSHRTTSTEFETSAGGYGRSGPHIWDRYPKSSDSGSQLYSTPVTRVDEWYTLRALFLRAR